MREEYYIKNMENFHNRISNVEDKLGGIYRVLEQIIGKELLRGQALHKVLMDKAVFTDQELKVALDALIAESKADLKAMEEKAQAEKAKIELLVPANANLTPPVDNIAPDAPVVHPDTLAKLQE
jgi:hypothetical protein